MPLDTKSCERIAKFIALLASPHDGEVLAAVSRLKSALTTAGMTLNDLAMVFEKLPEIDRAYDAAIKQQKPQQAPPKRSRFKDDGWQDTEDEDTIIVDLKACKEHIQYLTNREREFIRDIEDRYINMGRQLTPKQESWLKSIANSVRRHAKMKPKRAQGV